MDMLGHVNNTVHFRYMEQARIEWVHAPAQQRGHDGQGPVIARVDRRSGRRR
jgi:acyl-CoA thioester hydrolase